MSASKLLWMGLLVLLGEMWQNEGGKDWCWEGRYGHAQACAVVLRKVKMGRVVLVLLLCCC